MQTHSVRLFETSDASTLTTRIVGTVEQPVKLMHDGKPAIANLLGIVLAETIFHPQGGGQPSDKGQLNGIEVPAVRENKEESSRQDVPMIYHFVDRQAIIRQHLTLPVELALDVAFRKQCACSHTSGHLIADILEH